MNQLAPLAAGSVPAHIAQAQNKLTLNGAAQANLLPSFAVISFKGKTWSLKYRGDSTLLQSSPGTGHDGRPLPVMPMQSLPITIVGISEHIAKQFYEKQYSEGDDNAPDCFSVNGTTPDAASPKVQASSCAVCPMNKFGSKITENGKKAKACQDSRRLAVVPAGDAENEDFGGAMLLRLPPTSLSNLARYSQELTRIGADISQVHTEIGFNPEVAYPEITFKAIGWIEDPDEYAKAMELATSEQVERILNQEVSEVSHDPAQQQPTEATQALAGGRPAHATAGTNEAAQAAAQAAAEAARKAQEEAEAQAKAQAEAAAAAAAKAQADAEAAAKAAAEAAQQAQAQAQAQPQTTAPVKKASPFSKAAAQPQAPTGPAPTPAPAAPKPTPAAVQTAAVTAAPESMEAMIDDLISS
jgi:hypothetical protein